MVGRPLDLKVRAQDDYRIGSTKVTYRVNQRDAKSVMLDTPVKSGMGEQRLDWDYRKTLPDLKVGDSVKEGDTLLIVEAMKTMNHIPAPRGGTIKRILVDDGAAVEFGTPLVILE